MKKINSKQKKYFTTMAILIVVCEVLLRIDIMIFQSIGICLLPFIVLSGILLLRNDQKSNIN